MNANTVPFRPALAQDVMDDLRVRLRRTRFATPSARQPWASGTDPAYLRELVAYWAGEFDWSAREQALNRYPHFLATIDGQRLHFLHIHGTQAANAPTPLPLILSHGWPSSFIEMLPLVPLLTDPASHGGSPADTFDVVIPSLPGFAWSELPATGPLTRAGIADLWARLMTEVLGYDRFGAFGGDIGVGITSFLGARYPDRVTGIHLLYPHIPETFPPDQPPTPAERAYLDRLAEFDADDQGYSEMQSTRPDTVAAAPIDSPAGLASWIVDKYRAWSDCHGDVESRFDRDLLLTIITLYWATGTIRTSFRTYFDYDKTPPLPPITVPSAFTLTTQDPDFPRELAERSYADIHLWHHAAAGGHFLPLEEPELVANDLRTYFRPLRLDHE